MLGPDPSPCFIPGDCMSNNAGVWIDHRKAVIVALESETRVLASGRVLQPPQCGVIAHPVAQRSEGSCKYWIARIGGFEQREAGAQLEVIGMAKHVGGRATFELN